MKAPLKYCRNDSSPICSVGAAVGQILASESAFFSGRGRGSNSVGGRGNPRPRGDDQNFDPGRYHPKLDRSNLKLDEKKINAKKDGAVMICDFCGSFLHLWKDCRDRKEDRESRKFKTYVNFQEVDEDGHEQEEDDAYAYDDDEITSDSEAFIITIFQMTFMSHVRGTLWKLRVAVYGLGEAGKEWYESISD